MDLGSATEVPEARRARHLAHAVRKPLLERADLPEEFFALWVSAAVYDPDPIFCRWSVEPAVYAFGRLRVMTALLDYLRTGMDAEQAGAERACTAPMCRSAQTGLRPTHPAEAAIPSWMNPAM